MLTRPSKMIFAHDIDETYAHTASNVELMLLAKGFYKKDGIIKIDDSTLMLEKGAKEYTQYMLSIPKSSMLFFSAGTPDRNLIFRDELLALIGRSDKCKKVQVFSRQRVKGATKNLNYVLPVGCELSSAILIDNDMSNIHADAMHTQDKNIFDVSGDIFRYMVERLNFSKYNREQQIAFFSSYMLFYTAGMIKRAMRKAKSDNIPFADAMHQLQPDRQYLSGLTKQALLDAYLGYLEVFYEGLKILKRFNQDLHFAIDPKKPVSAIEIEFVQELEKVEQKTASHCKP